VQTWLVLEPRFDSKEMKQARKKLAEQMDPYDPSKHDQISEKVLEFFESAGTAYNVGLLNKELAASSFSYHAACWWEVVKAYVDKERKNLGDDGSVFYEFEKFAAAMKGSDKIAGDDLDKFLKDEKRLAID
jgi:hypothetical protein